MTQTLEGPAGVAAHAPDCMSLSPHTKIVATYGPACNDDGVFERLASIVDVFRLNSAHGKVEQLAAALTRIHAVSEKIKRPIGVLVDLAGPKIRLGELPGDSIELHAGEVVQFVRGDVSSTGKLTCTYPRLIDELSPGDRVVLADGAATLLVETLGTDFASCRVRDGGVVRSRQGVNLPGVRLSTPALTEEDRKVAEWAAGAGVDFLGLSFVRRASDVVELRQLVCGGGREQQIQIIAKIEKPEALDQLEAIVSASDAVMVARGDLGVEIDPAEVPMAQKRILSVCRKFQRPSIVATQMLDSMQESPLPTRAEASDVANAIVDGADVCMLSGETAVGKYPVEAASILRRIAEATERSLDVRDLPAPEAPPKHVHPITQALVLGAQRIAERLEAKLILVASHSGATALALSQRRGVTPVVGVSDHVATLRRMCLYWGVHPVDRRVETRIAGLAAFVDDWGREAAGLVAGDRIIFVSGAGLSPSGHDVVAVHEVP